MQFWAVPLNRQNSVPGTRAVLAAASEILLPAADGGLTVDRTSDRSPGGDAKESVPVSPARGLQALPGIRVSFLALSQRIFAMSLRLIADFADADARRAVARQRQFGFSAGSKSEQRNADR